MIHRKLTPEEIAALRHFAHPLAPSRSRQMITDLEAVTITPTGSTNPAWRFDIPGYTRPTDLVSELLSTEGIVDDADGTPVAVWIEVDQNGRLHELQLERFRPGTVVAPTWATLRTRSILEPRLRRPLTPGEIACIRHFAESVAPEMGQQMVADAIEATVQPISTDDSWFRLFIPGYRAPKGGELQPLPVDGLVDDADGAHIRVALFLDGNRRIADLELLREADGAVIDPNWTTFRLRGRRG